jgi:hypothetical protein
MIEAFASGPRNADIDLLLPCQSFRAPPHRNA